MRTTRLRRGSRYWWSSGEHCGPHIDNVQILAESRRALNTVELLATELPVELVARAQDVQIQMFGA